jgi:hypothetical protein
MLTNEEIASIPADPKLGFIAVMELISSRVKPLERGDRLSFVEATEAIGVLVAYCESAGLDYQFSPNPPSEDHAFWDWYHEAIRLSNVTKARFQFETRDSIRSTIVSTLRIPDEIKVQIRHFIGEIRKRVPGLKVTERQRDNIVDRLNALASEIEKSRSRTDALFSFVLEASKVTGEAAKNLEPLVDQVTKALGRAHQANEQKQIEPPPEQKKLPSPNGKKAAEDTKKVSIDDDIPF